MNMHLFGRMQQEEKSTIPPSPCFLCARFLGARCWPFRVCAEDELASALRPAAPSRLSRVCIPQNNTPAGRGEDRIDPSGK